jgi:aerobic carbon-monoxide dehydrogenase small subunit
MEYDMKKIEKETAKFIVNGKEQQLIIEPWVTLAEVLRDCLDLTGTKVSCGVGECANCTVLVDGKPILSCSTLAITVRDKNIVTIEGLSGDSLHSIQKAFVDHGAIQCGFCTPGMILTTKALLGENPRPTREEAKEYLAGNLCRCTGYIKIVDAVMAAAEAMSKGGK